MGSRSAKTRSSENSDGDETLLVGRVLRPHGVRGEVKIEVLSDRSERFVPGAELWLVAPGSRRQRVRVAGCRPVRGGALLHLEGYDHREQAATIRGGRLEIELSAVPEAPPGVYYHHQLIGCRCVDERHGELGEVADVVEDGGGALLQIEDGSGVLLVPFVESFLAAVDVDGRRIDLRLPPGLVETCASAS